MYLDDTARNWFLCARNPNDWEDTTAQPAAGGNPATPAVTGLRSMFLKEFQPDNYGLFQETRLRSRTQGMDEPIVRYYYEILNLCRLVDSNTLEAHRLEHLFRGFRPTLLRKLYPLKPKTCEEFLTLAKAYTEASIISEARGWKDAAMEPQKPLEQAPNLSVVYPDQQTEFMKSMREFIQDTAAMEWFRNYSRERFTSDARRSNRNPGDAQKQICERKSNRYGNAEKPLLTMGDLPLAVISLPAKEETEDTVLVSNERQEIPAYSIKPVPTSVYGSRPCAEGPVKHSCSKSVSQISVAGERCNIGDFRRILRSGKNGRIWWSFRNKCYD
ncbi:Uncharacterized protein APZ42_029752 [Daphnia magna]|uniref:Retrotransposon gag domain-containing protein n=1 Tax=Daphnia magna TaxID=35525 RepID=A0A164PCD7_9CRUS|nr:Uncharacterized protein APZ42_029752 [Daphnia magna]